MAQKRKAPIAVKEAAADVIAKVRTAVPELAAGLADAVDRQRIMSAYKAFRPILRPDLDEPGFRLPKLIRIAEPTPKFLAGPFGKAAVGNYEINKGIKFANIFPNRLEEFGLRLYPDANSGFYYIDPCDEHYYIAMDEYFSHCKQNRVNELVTIAQALGATHFKVTYMERIDKKTKGAATGGAKGGVLGGKGALRVKSAYALAAFTSVSIEKEAHFSGHEPAVPQLTYLKNDPEINALISMRMDNNELRSMNALVKLNSASSIKTSTAGKIDAVMRVYGSALSGEATVTRQTETESRGVLAYEIYF